MKQYLKDLVYEELEEYLDAAYGDYGSARDRLERLVLKVEQATLEQAAKVCESWRGGKLLLNAGEMSADELRTVRAVTDAAGREIRALKASND